MRNPELLWGRVCDYFNSISVDQRITSKVFLEYFGVKRNSVGYITLDNYKGMLCSSGYIELVDVGVYKRVKIIPLDLTTSAAGIGGGSGKKYQLWYRMIQYHRTLEIGTILTSKDYIKKFNPTKCAGQSRILDVYKSKLRLIGIIETVSHGKHRIIKIPSIDLKSSDCKK